jgi:hypothetical protein
MNQRRFIHRVTVTALLLLSACFASAAPPDANGETLYNGITLPVQWPPSITLSREPQPVPYLASPPEVIPIDVGRQLFVDDFLIEQSSLERRHHQTRPHPKSPVLQPDQPWEQTDDPTAMAFSDGVWFDPHDRLFKMWYMGGYLKTTCYAESTDGVTWRKPPVGERPQTNVVRDSRRDSTSIWLDHDETDPARRFKMLAFDFAGGVSLRASADGKRWSGELARVGAVGDRSTMFYNPFRKRWIYSFRLEDKTVGRARSYLEREQWLIKAPSVNVPDSTIRPVPWIGADRLDPERVDLKTSCELYNLDCVAYESLLLGLFTIWSGQPADRAKPNQVFVGYSRDGFHWHRPDRTPFIPVSERQGDWNWGNVQSVGGGCLVVGDELYFYFSGREGIAGSTKSGVCRTGLALLRRDGFTSLAAGEQLGSITTRKLKFTGKHLFVNLGAPQGELRVEALDADGRVIEPFTRENCRPLAADSTAVEVRWKGTSDLAADLSALAGRPIRFRFHLTGGDLYSFWVAPTPAGASQGYVAAGGPHFTGPTDTVGAPR